MILLDTHVAVWLYRDGATGVPPSVAEVMNASELGIAPIVRLELQYLNEIGRLTVGPDELLGHLTARIGLTVIDVSSQELVDAALPMTWTRDPFDRLISAHCVLTGGKLATKDETIRAHLSGAFWTEEEAGGPNT